jgi:hypothetical protein
MNDMLPTLSVAVAEAIRLTLLVIEYSNWSRMTAAVTFGRSVCAARGCSVR